MTPLHHNWLSPWTRITQCSSGCMKGRTHIFPTLVQHSFHNCTDVPLVLFFHYHDSFQNLYKPVSPQKVKHGFPVSCYSSDILGLGQPQCSLQPQWNLEDTSCSLHSQPREYQSKTTPSFSDVTAQSFLNLYFLYLIAFYIVSHFMYHPWIFSHMCFLGERANHKGISKLPNPCY